MKQKLLLLFAVLAMAVSASAENYILYTSSDGNVVEPHISGAFGATIVSNTYEDGQGKIVFDGEVTSIGFPAFDKCYSLTSVTIPNSVTSIGKCAFYYCSKLASVVIPNSVTSIGEYAFHGCTSLTSVVIPNSVTSIGEAAFANCGCLESFTGKFASEDHRCLIVDGVLNSFAPAGLTNYEIPNFVTTIGDYAFSGCSGLTSVEIPNSVTTIGEYAFSSCSSLTSVEIPNSVTEIGRWAFYGCTSLTSVVIPNSVTEISNYAFVECKNLAEIFSLKTSVPSLGQNVFTGLPDGFKIKVLGNLVDNYKKALNWSTYDSHIEAISTALIDGTPYTYNFRLGNCDITYERTFSHTGWQAIFLPFSMNYNDWKNYGTLARLSGVTNEGVLEWTTINEGATKAGLPFIFKPNAAGKVTFSVSNKDLESCEDIFYDSYDGYKLSGTYTTKTDMAATHAYALSNGNFYYTTDNSKTLKPYRIFLTVPESVYAAGAPIRSIIDGVDVAAIEGIDVDIDNHGQQQYNLQGIRVNDSYKGIVIINGKKVMRK